MPDGQKKSRMTTLKAADEDQPLLKLPDVAEASYIIAMFHEAGLMSTNGMGAIPLSWQEIDAWIRVTESEPQVWERLLIKELSDVYVSELNQSTDKAKESPWMPPVEEVVDRPKVANKFLEFARRFNNARKNPGVPPANETKENGS